MRSEVIKSTLVRVHVYSIKILCVLIIINLLVTYLKVPEFELAYGTWRMIFLFVGVCINYYFLSRLDSKIGAGFYLALTYLAFFIYPLLPIPVNYPQSIFLLLSTLIIFSVLPYLIFDVFRDKHWITGILVVQTATFLVAFDHCLDHLDNERYGLYYKAVTDQPLIIGAYFGSWVFVQALFYAYVKMNIKLKLNIEKLNDTLDRNVKKIESRNDELAAQAEKLMKLQQSIKRINDQLEMRIQDRTKLLESQNDILSKYGFINSTLVRKPVNEIIRTEIDPNMSTSEIEERLRINVEKLDEMTLVISDILNDQTSEKISKLEELMADTDK